MVAQVLRALARGLGSDERAMGAQVVRYLDAADRTALAEEARGLAELGGIDEVPPSIREGASVGNRHDPTIARPATHVAIARLTLRLALP